MSPPSAMGMGLGMSLLLAPLPCLRCWAGAVCITVRPAWEHLTHPLALSRAGEGLVPAQGLAQAHPAAWQRGGHSPGTA